MALIGENITHQQKLATYKLSRNCNMLLGLQTSSPIKIEAAAAFFTLWS